MAPIPPAVCGARWAVRVSVLPDEQLVMWMWSQGSETPRSGAPGLGWTLDPLAPGCPLRSLSQPPPVSQRPGRVMVTGLLSVDV